ncbi:MAG: hypothetical protein MUC48_00695 [Leptolyngbya sp. Prado105]|nr:hypothetical protein [Leptolyngbya sp. Prado105]
MTSTISGIVTLLLTIGAVTLHYTSTASESQDPTCAPSEVFRFSDRACYVPQGE